MSNKYEVYEKLLNMDGVPGHERQIKKFVKEDLGFATPFNTFSEAEQPNDPLAKEMFRYMKNENVKTIPWAFAGFPSEEFKTTFGDALLQYVQGNTTFDKLKETVKNKWQSERK